MAVGGVFLALFLLLCFGGYTLVDPESTTVQPSALWSGKAGYFIARLVMDFLGITSFLIPVLLLIFSVQVFLSTFPLSRLPYVFAGTTGLLLAASSLFGGMERQFITIFDQKYPAAGHVGNFLHDGLAVYFGVPGAVLIFLALLILSLMASLHFSLYACTQKIIHISGWLIDKRPFFKKNILAKDVGVKVNNNIKIATELQKTVTDDLSVPNVHTPVKLPLVADDEYSEFNLVPPSTGEYRLPGLALLDKPDIREYSIDRQYYYEVSKKLEAKLQDFGVVGKVIGISPGPVITTYEFSPAPGVKINKITALADDLALGLKTESVRIVGSVPGKGALGIEIPNPARETVYLRDIIGNEIFQKNSSKLTIVLGMDVVGNPVIANLAKMPHLLIAGATGSGKSVAVNTIICSILYNATPEEVRVLLIDPKRIELSCYEDIPHLLHPVVVAPKLASRALQWAVREMERRYEIMEEAKVKSLASYNKIAETKLPLIVIIIDELADLMMVSSKEVEDSVARLAQMARAAGMHLILATQRPSVDVLTGLIKANFPTRMSFKVSSKIDSRTILDAGGAEHLLGAGDMLFLPPGSSKLQRIHGAYISEQETGRIVSFLKEQRTAKYDESALKINEEPDSEDVGAEDYDEKYDEAVALVSESGQASISMVQRRLRVGYNRAARMIETMEKEGIVGPADGSKPREVLVRKNYFFKGE